MYKQETRNTKHKYKNCLSACWMHIYKYKSYSQISNWKQVSGCYPDVAVTAVAAVTAFILHDQLSVIVPGIECDDFLLMYSFGPLLISPKGFESAGFALKVIKCFRPLYQRLVEFKNATIACHFGFENSVREITWL